MYTPKAGGPYDPDRLTQVGRALRRLGVEHILAWSPQARGRSERLNRTLQDRLVNELRVAGCDTTDKANRYIEEVFIPRYNEAFGRAPRDSDPAFVACSGVDLEQILCLEQERCVGRDNTVSLDGVRLRSTSSRAAAPAPGSGSSSGSTSTAASRSGAGRAGSGAMTPTQET